jgi:hypothetical protein
VALSADLASFGNTTPEEAALSLGAALRGEAEPIRKYNVTINEAALKQQALKMNLISTTKEGLNNQQKTLATHALILSKTSDAQGDFGRTAGGVANQQRIMSATLEDVQAKLGEKLLPAFQQGIQTLNEFVANADWDGIFGGLEEVINDVAEPWGEFFDAIGDVYRALTAGLSTGEKTAGIFDAIKVSVNLGLIPIKLLSKWLRAVVDYGIIPLINAGKNVISWFNEVRESGGFVGAVFNGIASAAGAVIDKLVGVAEFIGLVDSAEEKQKKNKEKAEKAKQKAAEETAKFEQAKNKEKAAANTAAIEKEKADAAASAAAAKERAKKILEINAQFNKEMMSLADELTLMTIADENERAKKQLEIQKRNDLASIEASEFTAKQKAELKAKIDEKYNQLEIDRQKAQNEKIKKLEQEVIDFIQSAKDEQRQDELTAAKEDLAFANSIIEKSKTLSLKDVDEQEERFNKIAAAGLFSEKQLLLAQKTFAKMREEVSNQEASKAQESIAKTQETFSQIAGAVTSVTGPAFAAINSLYDANLQRLEKEKNQRLANENLTAEERLRIEEEYEKKKNEMMAEQFEVNRISQIIQATMSAAQAALNAFASTAAIPVVGPGLAPAAAAIAAGFGALQIGVIAAQPNPYKFYDGTPYLQLGDNPKGRDTIPVMAHEGEAIIPTRNNLQYPGLAKSWIDGDLDRYINNNFVRPALMEQQKQAEEEFADRLAASMALQMAANFDDYRLHRDLKEQTAVLRDGFHSMKTTRKKLRGA